MNNSSTQKSRYFLAELIINCLFFVISASICLNLFAFGYTQSTNSKNLSMATLKAQDMAESIKSTGEDTDKLRELTGAVENNDIFTVYYDDDWNTSSAENANFSLVAHIQINSLGMLYADIDVTDITGDDELLYALKINKFLEDFVVDAV